MAEHIQRKTDENTANIPVWYGEPQKDEFSLAAYINKLDTAKTLLVLDEPTTFQYFQQSVRGSAASWLDTWIIENRDRERHWAHVKPDFRKAFGDATTTFTFAKDITATNLATFGGDFNKFYAYVAKTAALHCEPFIDRRINLPDGHGLNNAQQAIVARLVTAAYREVHDTLMLEFFLHGLPKTMYDKVVTKHDLTKPSQVIAYLKECDEAARKNSVVPPPQAPMAAHITPIDDEQVDAASTYNSQNRGNFRGRYNNNRGRGNASSSTRGAGNSNSYRGQSSNNYSNNYRGQNNRGQSTYRGNTNTSNDRKPLICIYCRKPGHDQEKCFNRIRDNQPCLTAKGAQYFPQKVAANAENSEERQQSQQNTEAFSVFHFEV